MYNSRPRQRRGSVTLLCHAQPLVSLPLPAAAKEPGASCCALWKSEGSWDSLSQESCEHSQGDLPLPCTAPSSPSLSPPVAAVALGSPLGWELRKQKAAPATLFPSSFLYILQFSTTLLPSASGEIREHPQGPSDRPGSLAIRKSGEPGCWWASLHQEWLSPTSSPLRSVGGAAAGNTHPAASSFLGARGVGSPDAAPQHPSGEGTKIPTVNEGTRLGFQVPERTGWGQLRTSGCGARCPNPSAQCQQTVHRYMSVRQSWMMKRPPNKVTMKEARKAHHTWWFRLSQGSFIVPGMERAPGAGIWRSPASSATPKTHQRCYYKAISLQLQPPPRGAGCSCATSDWKAGSPGKLFSSPSCEETG
ncbi:uncharacterized protein AAES06_022682 isoform 2-T3 [Glossophaga mutica]